MFILGSVIALAAISTIAWLPSGPTPPALAPISSSPWMPWPGPTGTIDLEPGAPRHLYIASTFFGENSFPLTNGIPAKQPDAIITGLKYPEGLTVDRAGYLYVGDIGTSMLSVFAPGANGPAKPVRQIPMYVQHIKLWRDYLIAQGPDTQVYVYDVSPGVAPIPVERLAVGHVNLGFDVHPDGRLFLSWLKPGGLGTVFDTVAPKLRPNSKYWQLRRQFWPPTGDGFWYGIVADQTDIYVQRFPARGPAQVEVFPINSSGSTKPVRTIITPGCNAGGNTQLSDLAIYDNYLYEACNSNDYLFIVDRRGNGRVHALFKLRSSLHDIFAIALGPQASPPCLTHTGQPTTRSSDSRNMLPATCLGIRVGYGRTQV